MPKLSNIADGLYVALSIALIAVDVWSTWFDVRIPSPGGVTPWLLIETPLIFIWVISAAFVIPRIVNRWIAGDRTTARVLGYTTLITGLLYFLPLSFL